MDVHNLFIDFQAAYDTVWIKETWSDMHNLVSPKINLICAEF